MSRRTRRQPPPRACTWQYTLWFAWTMLWMQALGLLVVFGTPVLGLLAADVVRGW